MILAAPQKGFTNDIEVSIGAADGSVGPDSIVGKFRRQIWAEFLHLSEDDPKLTDPMAGIAELDRLNSLSRTGQIRA